jgi:hypothetical protein
VKPVPGLVDEPVRILGRVGEREAKACRILAEPRERLGFVKRLVFRKAREVERPARMVLAVPGSGNPAQEIVNRTSPTLEKLANELVLIIEATVGVSDGQVNSVRRCCGSHGQKGGARRGSHRAPLPVDAARNGDQDLRLRLKGKTAKGVVKRNAE